jgi:hypothetical protein
MISRRKLVLKGFNVALNYEVEVSTANNDGEKIDFLST